MTEALNPELVLHLRVASAAFVADGIREFELVEPQGAPLPPFTPGAHVLLQAPSGVTRRYSLVDAPEDVAHYVIAVRREAAGRGGSISVVDGIGVGDTVHVSMPHNEFALNEAAASYVFIAGGIGITPIRSMVRHVLSTTAKPFRLYYLTRSPGVTAYRDEFTGPELAGNVILHHDDGDPGRAYDLWPVLETPKPGRHVYCCGPRPLLDAVRDMTGHWSSSAIHFEDFGTRTPPRHDDDRAFIVRFGRDGSPIEVGATQSILAALRAAGHRIASSCESGTCGTCRMRVLAGQPDHRDLVLSENERQDHVIVCVSRAKSAELVVAP